jgi:hypothetical protein
MYGRIRHDNYSADAIDLRLWRRPVGSRWLNLNSCEGLHRGTQGPKHVADLISTPPSVAHVGTIGSIRRVSRLTDRPFSDAPRASPPATAQISRPSPADYDSRRRLVTRKASVVSPKFVGIRPALHPRWLRCSSLKYSRYSRSSRLAIGAHRRPRCTTNFGDATLASAGRPELPTSRWA